VRLYPLKFYEILKPKIWGGRALEAIVGKRLPEGRQIGESWELVDHFDDVSVVRNGLLEGQGLREIWRRDPKGVLGEALAGRKFKEFPLLVKFIDASDVLSVQVHPDEKYAEKHDARGESGKDETWYVMAADKGAELIVGLREGLGRDEFKKAVKEGRVDECLNRIRVKAGDVIHITAGTVHAIGKGIVVCEIQQTSDATYRLWDWGRVDETGKPRPLHSEDALRVIDFDRGPVKALVPVEESKEPVERLLLDRCEVYAIERISGTAQFMERSEGGCFQILVCTGGSGSIFADGDRLAYSAGDTVLVPAAVGEVAVEPAEPTSFLKAYIPEVHR